MIPLRSTYTFQCVYVLCAVYKINKYRDTISFNRKYIFKWWIFHCHVCFRGGGVVLCFSSGYPIVRSCRGKPSAKKKRWWKTTAVDGWNPANQLRLIVYPFITLFTAFYTSQVIWSITKSVTRLGIQFKEPGILTHPPFRSEAPFPSLRSPWKHHYTLLSVSACFFSMSICQIPWEWDKMNGLHTEWKCCKVTLLHNFLRILMYTWYVGHTIQVFKEFSKFENHLAWYFQGHIQHPKMLQFQMFFGYLVKNGFHLLV